MKKFTEIIEVGSDFTGVGAFEEAMDRVAENVQNVFCCDMDKYARESYLENRPAPNYFPLDVYEREIPVNPLDIYMTSPPSNDNLITNFDDVRRLTPRECFRLQDFPDTFKIVVSDTQAYKQAGNSITVKVLEEIIRKFNFKSNTMSGTTKTFYNTIRVGGHELNEVIRKVEKQNDRVYEIMKQVNKSMTPFQVQQVYILLFGSVPITSIRRAMTSLTNDGKLEKLDEKRQGQFGQMNYCWIVRKEEKNEESSCS